MPSNIEGLYYVAKSYGKIYQSLLDAAIEARSVVVDDKYRRLFDLLAEIPSLAIDQLENYPSEAMTSIDDAVETHRKTGDTISLSLSLSLSIDDESLNDLTNEMARLSNTL